MSSDATITHDRASLGDAAVFPLGVAARLAGGEQVKVKAWLRSLGIIWTHPITEDEWVTWGDVRRALEARSSKRAAVAEGAARLAGLKRTAL